MTSEELDNETDAPLATRNPSPIRTCIVTRQVKEKEELLRFVVSPDGQLVADLAHKLPGRGMYVTCSKLLVGEAIAKRAFSRAAKRQVEIPADFLNRLQQLMAARVAEALSFARKGGLVISGFEKVEAALKKGDVAALIHAADAGEDGKKKLGNVAKAVQFASSPLEGEPKSQGDFGGGNSPGIDVLKAPPTAPTHTLPLRGRVWVGGDSPSGGELARGAAGASTGRTMALEEIPTYEFLSRELLGSVVGRENAVHVAVLHGPAGAFFIESARRFALFLD